MREYFVVYPKNSGRKLFETDTIELAEKFVATQDYVHKLRDLEDKPETYEIVRIMK